MARSSQAIFGLIGAGGHGRETMPFVRAHIAAHPDLGIDVDRVVFVDRQAGTAVGGHLVLAEDEFAAMDAERLFAVAVGQPAVRRAIAERLESARCRALTLIARTATVVDSARVAPGALIAPYALINADASVGRHLIANAHSSIAHDCLVGDFVTLGPRACVNGGVRIGDGVEIGAGALIRQGLSIGAGAVIGMGAVVVKDVAPGATVVGNPAREVAR
ncbi:acetyltransferase [Brevundimonas sp.]|uniref:acetyltransferase n=1 Tax=Brevundimonas sp. TaxID=1871086 RepID=UPI00286A6DD3|nr:acetyltransferase [Brevundimonas sp.]